MPTTWQLEWALSARESRNSFVLALESVFWKWNVKMQKLNNAHFLTRVSWVCVRVSGREEYKWISCFVLAFDYAAFLWRETSVFLSAFWMRVYMSIVRFPVYIFFHLLLIFFSAVFFSFAFFFATWLNCEWALVHLPTRRQWQRQRLHFCCEVPTINVDIWFGPVNRL